MRNKNILLVLFLVFTVFAVSSAFVIAEDEDSDNESTISNSTDDICRSGVCNFSLLVREQVKCIFENAAEVQKCYASKGDSGKLIGCSGLGSCVVEVSGEPGENLTWKSSCGGYDYTTTNAENEYARFKCSPVPEPIMVKEEIKCIFKGSTEKQRCYTAEQNSRSECIGEQDCTTEIEGKKGEKMIWKSSCGGYAYTIIDGDNEYAEFNCIPEGNTTIRSIENKGFNFVYWQCYNGEEQKQGGKDSCKSSDDWHRYAKKFCADKCSKDGEKCGINSFSVSGECYSDQPDNVFVPEPIVVEENETEIETQFVCKDSCPLDGKCYPFGYRKGGKFCSDSASFVLQAKADTSCDNNFECSSNLCVSGTCVSEGVIQRVLNWFKGVFR